MDNISVASRKEARHNLSVDSKINDNESYTTEHQQPHRSASRKEPQRDQAQKPLSMVRNGSEKQITVPQSRAGMKPQPVLKQPLSSLNINNQKVVNAKEQTPTNA